MKKIVKIIILLLMSFSSFAQQEQWGEIDKYLQDFMPRKAMPLIQSIQNKALEKQDCPNLVRSYIYMTKANQQIYNSAKALQLTIEQVNQVLDKINYPCKAVMQGFLAHLLKEYYKINRYKILNRTYIPGQEKPLDEWSIEDFANETYRLFDQALAHRQELLKYKSKDFKALFYEGDLPWELRPTLFDFVANWAIEFYQSEPFDLTHPSQIFQIDDDQYFAPAPQFASLKIETPDSLNPSFKILKTYQWLIQAHLNEPNSVALTDADINRINFVHQKYAGTSDPDKLYEQALQYIIQNQKNWRSDLAKYYLAELYTQKAKEKKDDNFYQKALNLLEQLKNSKDKQAQGLAHNLKNSILQKSLHAKIENIIYPEQNFPLQINFRNLKGNLYVFIYKIKEIDSYYDYERIYKKIKKQKPIYKKTIELPKITDHFSHTTETVLQGLPVGKYLVVLSVKPEPEPEKNIVNYATFTVASIAIKSQKFYDKFFFWFVDRLTGEPLPGLKVKVETRDKRKITKIYHTDSSGKITIQPTGSLYYGYQITAYRGSEVYQDETYLYPEPYREPSPNKRVKIFLDRKIYRPGQTVYYKGIVYQDGAKDKISLLPNEIIKLSIRSANYQVVKTIQTVSNEFGSFSGQFQIPENYLSGAWKIETPWGSEYFRVEEYKRPSFKVEFLPIQGTIAPNKEITIVGKAINYNGTPLTDAQVKVLVQMEKVDFWWFAPSEKTNILSTKLQTNDKGEFIIKFKTLPLLDDMANLYTIKATVTDLNGETHSASTSFMLSNRNIILSIQAPENINIKQQLKLKFSVKNLEDQELNQPVTYRVVKLKPYVQHPLIQRLWDDPDTMLYTQEQWQNLLPVLAYKDSMADYKSWQEDKIIAQGKTTSNQQLELKLEQPGIYKIIATSFDSAAKKDVKTTAIVVGFDPESDKALAPIPFYAFMVNDTVTPGEKAQFVIGSGWKNAKVLYQITYNNHIIAEQFIELNKSQKTLSFPVKLDMRGGVGVNILLIKHNRDWNEKLNFCVPYPSKKLIVRKQRFFDKLKPGQPVEWSFIIAKENGQKTIAEVLASMYDASLDAFEPNIWSFDLNRPRNDIAYFNANSITRSNSLNTLNYQDLESSYVGGYYYSFNWYGLDFHGYFMRRAFYRTARTKRKAITAAKPQETMAMPLAADEQVQAEEETLQEPAEQEPDIEIRTNFAETAMFYPQLLTNEKGEVVIKFTVPQSLTQWHFQIFAHNKNLDFGLLDQKVVTRKDLMIYPNEPRFVRQGDTLTFSVKITNSSDQNLNIKTELQIRNARTNELLKIFTPDQPQQIQLAPEQSTQVSWTLTIPQNLIDPIIYRVVAYTENYSDGQQNIIPVLSNKMLVTESMPLPVNGKQTKTFDLKPLINKSETAQPFRLTLEFNSNPVWYAITALPYLMEYPYECNEQLFARFYSNTLASYIVNSDPNIKRVFEIWKKTGSQALISELEKKEQLKQIILQATPWLLTAQNETEAKEQIALLMDLNKMAYEQQKTLSKLWQNQNPDGGWPWFKGDRSDWFVTQYILIGFARLDQRNVFRIDQQTEKRLHKAIRFTDRQAKKYYQDLLKHYNKKQLKKTNLLSPLIVQYIYMHSLYQDIEPLPKDEYFKFFYNQLKEHWTSLNLYSQAQAAIALYKTQNSKLAQKIIESFRQRAIYSEELGYYWENNRAGWLWYQAPIETHAMIIEAFATITNDTNFIEAAKRWLLKHKQTNHWQSTKATTEAIWALTFTGKNWLKHNKLVQIKLGSITLPDSTDTIEAGTGYFHHVWNAEQIRQQNLDKLTVKNPNPQPTWGAIYYQYFENLDKIKSWNTNLKIQRQLFKEVQGKTGKYLQPITEQTPLKVGDVVVVRLVIQTDRHMDYVHIKDLRATGFEPTEQLSGYRWQGGLGYYQSIGDAAANFFVSHLSPGKYVFEYRLYATIAGNMSGGLTTIQCMYAPEFSAHSQGTRVEVKQ